jgi:exosortase
MRNIYFIGYLLATLALYFAPLKELVGLFLDKELYSYFPLIPVVSLFFLFRNRKDIFSEAGYSFRWGLPIAAAGMFLYWIGQSRIWDLNPNDHLSLMIFSLLICLIAGFIAFYGIPAFRMGMFPVLFLVFIVPPPTIIIEPLIHILLVGSAGSAYKVFQVLGVPVFRHDFIFELPGLSIEVAKQCSGINSTMALFITSIIAGYLFLETGWRRVVLLLAVFPITVFKNSLRIVTISLLAAYVDPIYIENHWIHRSGGPPFFILAMLTMVPVLLVLRRTEQKKEDSPPASLESQSTQR